MTSHRQRELVSLMEDLLSLVSPGERGDPMSPLRWTCKSLRRLAAELRERGHRISHTVVGELLKRCNFSLPLRNPFDREHGFRLIVNTESVRS